MAPTGDVVAEWGPGSGPGQFSKPRGITADVHGNVYVVDAGNARIQKLRASRS